MLATKKSETEIVIFHPGEVSRVSGKRRPHSKNIRGHHGPWHHSPGLGMQFGTRTGWDKQSCPCFHGLLGCKHTNASPSTHHLPGTTSTPAVLQTSSVLLEGSHCQPHCSQLSKGERKKCTQAIATVKTHEWNMVFRNWHYPANTLSSSSLE